MKLLENIECEKGITLNSQLVDLLSILDNESLTVEEQNTEIEQYIAELKSREEKFTLACENGEKYQFLLDDVISTLDELPQEQIQKLKQVYLSNISDLTVCNREKMEKILAENGLDSSFHEKIMKGLKNRDYAAKEGILLLTPDKVRALYSHLFENGNRYDRVTFDNVGKYSGYVSADGETYTPEKLEKMQRFCELHGMKSKINALMFYADFPKVYEQSLTKRVESGEITEEDKKRLMQKTLFDYVRNIGQTYGSRVESVDVLNELIYDPVMKEEGFDEPTSEYQYRTQGWHKYLDLEDMCKMALIARKSMPGVKFTYNDMNWTDKDKRKQIIDLLKQIKQIEEKFRTEGVEIDGQIVKLEDGESLIDSIGFEAHLTSDVDLDEMDSAFNEVISEIGLPVEITELDIACFGQDKDAERKKQGQVLSKIMQMIQSHPEITSLTIWSQSDECSFMNLKNSKKEWKMVYASLLDSNFEEKDFELVMDLLASAVHATEKTVTTGNINGQVQAIEAEEVLKTQEQETQKTATD